MVWSNVSIFQILTIAVLGILITSPIGAIGITVAGPRTLKRASPVGEDSVANSMLPSAAKGNVADLFMVM